MNSVPLNSVSALGETTRCRLQAAPHSGRDLLFRLRHQIMHEWRAQWGLLLTWVLLLGLQW